MCITSKLSQAKKEERKHTRKICRKVVCILARFARFRAFVPVYSEHMRDRARTLWYRREIGCFSLLAHCDYLVPIRISPYIYNPVHSEAQAKTQTHTFTSSHIIHVESLCSHTIRERISPERILASIFLLEFHWFFSCLSLIMAICHDPFKILVNEASWRVLSVNRLRIIHYATAFSWWLYPVSLLSFGTHSIHATTVTRTLYWRRVQPVWTSDISLSLSHNLSCAVKLIRFTQFHFLFILFGCVSY